MNSKAKGKRGELDAVHALNELGHDTLATDAISLLQRARRVWRNKKAKEASDGE